MAHTPGEQPRGRRHMNGGKHGRVDDGVPFPSRKLAKVAGAGPVTMQCLGTWPGMAAAAS